MQRLVASAIYLFSISAFAGENDTCFRVSKEWVTCQSLSEQFLSSLKYRTKAEVIALMGAPGVERDPSVGLHFMGNSMNGFVGEVSIKFKEGRVSFIWAMVDGADGIPLEYLWNRDVSGSIPNECADLPGSILPKCNK